MSSDRRDPERWSRIEHLFDQAIELEPSQRAEYLCRATADEQLQREVEELLRAAAAPGPLDQPVGVLARGLTRHATAQAGGSALQAGKTIGSWRILDSLGEGGMGRVFLAERREGGFDQIAALKLLRWELASDAMVERFRNEQRLLARLEHPGIARLIDGGVSEEGLPYLVMERVEGRPIDDHCQETNAPLEERLRLFAQVCDAVQAAHRRLIIHRDLKPSNLLVTRAGQVKVLDFGVAKLLSESAADRLELEPLDDPEVRAALQTRIGTGYYRLLRRDAEAWELLSRAERELEPRGESAELANLRLEKALLASERGDYEVQRQLARQAKSFFTRVEGSGSPGVARALLVEALAFQYQSDLEEANRLALESLDLVGLLANPPPLLRAQALATLGTIAELQQRGPESIDLNRRALAIFEEVGGPSDPDVIALYDEIGISYHALGRYEEAERFYRKAIELHQARFGADHPNAIDPLTDLSRLLLDQGRFEEALVYAGRAVVAGSGLPESDYERIATQINLATAELETGDVESAASRYRTALGRFRALLGDEHPAVARARSLLADSVRAQGDLEQAERLYRLALHPENRRLEEAWLGLGRVLADTGRPAEARELFEKALDRRLETHPDDHWRVADVEAELALLAVKEDGNRAAIADLEQAVADLEIDLGSGNWRLERLGG